ncbi:MAG TPA: endonuclease III [Gemmatimonadaceae bacterium]
MPPSKKPAPRTRAAKQAPAEKVVATKRAAKQAPKQAPKQAAKKAVKQAVKKAAAKKVPTQRAPARSAIAPKMKAAVRRKNRADPAEVLRRLAATYPDAHCALDHRNAFELLVATILSAQCTDKRVNMVTPALFARFPHARALAAAGQEEVEELVRTTGFFRSKAKNLIAMATALVERHGGEVPQRMDDLVVLPGVGRKTANVILGNAFGINEGVVVDTHVARLSQRLGLTTQADPVKIEADLMQQFPRERWTMLAHYLIDHGRAICDARRPRCGECPLADLCPSASV